jgi:branched-subunit amino acid aminotransferase/4-amino-4-deoxychorismate lyase
MPAQDAANRDELWWAEPSLKARLLRDPVTVLAERGVHLPAGLPLPVVHGVVRLTFLLWVDGKVVALEKFHIDPFDEGLLFGRGLWESTRTIGGVPWLWSEHLDRLRRTAALLDVAVAPERLPDSRQVSEFVRMLTAQDVVVRLNVTAGRPGKAAGLVWMSAALPPVPHASVRLQSRRTPVLKEQPYLAWKTFQYAERLRTGRLAVEAGFDSALMLDPNDNVLEAAHANIFVRLPDMWATPAVDGMLFLPGTVRRRLLEKAPVPITEQTIPYAALASVREAFLTNSNVGIVPVTQIDQHAFPIGQDTLSLSRWLQANEPPALA